MFKLNSVKKNGIRKGEITTSHGKIKTPFFMPDATRALIKQLSINDLKKTGTSAIVVNTFHLYLQPGIKIIKSAGGIHKFMNFSGPILSDSGGFQIFSLIHKNKDMGKITDKGARFKSPLNGSWHDLSPEKSIQIQFDLGVDMMVCLDDCPPNEFSFTQMEQAIKRTLAWAKRCKLEYLRQVNKRKIPKNKRPLLFSVVQGGPYLDLRKKCAQELIKIGFDGYGFGARPVDKDGNFLEEVIRETAKIIPSESLRFALGIGTPEDIERCASLGWDMFDCVIPTREGRHGKLFLQKRNKHSSFNINNSKFSKKYQSINLESKFPELRQHSLAYLHHLFKLKEGLGQRLASLNNLEYYQKLMTRLRK